MRAPKALRSGYGASERPQEILTPPFVLDKLPWPVALDPCSCDGSLVQAEHRYFGPPRDAGGLELPWMDRTYCNPPYKDLKLWLAKAREEWLDGYRIVVLAPVRTHRKWFREAMISAQSVTFLDPVKFVGYEGAFPVPLCLLEWRP